MILASLALLAAYARQAEEACLKCHAPMQQALQKKNKHAAVDMGCATCHIDHQDATAAKGKTAPFLNETLPALCVNCHDPKDKTIAAAHQGQPFETAICTNCHDPHASAAAKLQPEKAHGPYAARQCGACHKPAKDGKVVLLSDASSELCFKCHGELQQKLTTAKAQHSLLTSDPNSCTTCHNPHASNLKKALTQKTSALCSTCHTDLTADKKFVHHPVRESCTLCHDPHASDQPKQLYVARQDLCLGCHDASAISKFTGDAPISLFNGKVTLPAKPYAGLKMLSLSGGGKAGHPMPNHPVFAEAKDGQPGFDCVSCHKPHAANGNLRRFDTESAVSSPLCIRCHK